MKSLFQSSNFFTALLLCQLLFIMSSCDVNKDCCTCEVPYSESGAGTLGCMMDGDPWAACNFARDIVNNNVLTTVENIGNQVYLKIKNSKVYNGGSDALYIQLWNPRIGIIPNRLNLSSDGSVGYIKGEFFTENAPYRGIFTHDTLSNYHL